MIFDTTARVQDLIHSLKETTSRSEMYWIFYDLSL